MYLQSILFLNETTGLVMSRDSDLRLYVNLMKLLNTSYTLKSLSLHPYD